MLDCLLTSTCVHTHTYTLDTYLPSKSHTHTHTCKKPICGFSHLMNDSKVFGYLPEKYLKYTNIHLSKMLVELFLSWNSYSINDTNN